MKEPNYYVFFDVDETIISIKSMFDFLKFYYCHGHRFMGQIKYFLTHAFIKSLVMRGKPREYINAFYYRLYKGKRELLVKECGSEWFRFCLENKKQFFNKRVLQELFNHKAQGARIVLVSGSFKACLEPIARYVGADIILASDLEVIDGVYSGKLTHAPVIGHGKAIAIQSLLRKEDYNSWQKCFAYGDHISDLPMLNLVGNPVAVQGDLELEKLAKANNWEVITRHLIGENNE